jgi:hypothetical protein
MNRHPRTSVISAAVIVASFALYGAAFFINGGASRLFA